MMYRVEIDIGFIDEKTAQDVVAYVEALKEKMVIPDPDLPIGQDRKIRYHECFHDEKDPAPCGPYVESDLTRSDEADVLQARTDDKAAEEAAKIGTLPHGGE